MLLEKEVRIVCREKDVALVTELLPAAKKEFLDILTKEAPRYKNFDVELEVDPKLMLSEKIIGGIELNTLNRKIKIDNTIDKRLELVISSSLPDIKRLLFDN